MHESVRQWIAEEALRVDHAWPVIEIGSRDVNGSVRDLFANSDYLGVDCEPGPGVDLLANSHEMPLQTASFGVGVCCEMLEHDQAPWLTLRELMRVLMPGSVLLLTCRGFDERGCFHVHEYPGDFVRYSVAGVDALLRHTGFGVQSAIADPQCPGVFARAIRP